MADAAEQLPDPGMESESAPESRIIPIKPVDPAVGAERRTEGGLTLRFAFEIPKLPSVMTVNTWTHQQLINGALIVVVALLAGYTLYQAKFAGGSEAAAAPHEQASSLRPNVETEFNPTIESPVVGQGSYVDRMASVIGNVTIGEKVFVAPLASIRGDEGQPISIGDGSNVQDFVMIHALETFSHGKLVEKNLVTVEGKKYAVFIGSEVSLAHQSQVHGPAAVGDHTFIGMQALVFKAVIGKNVVVEPGAKVVGVTIADGRYVPAGKTVTSQAEADALPQITESYPFATLNDGVLHVNQEFADGYLELAEGGKSGSAHASAPASGGSSGH